MGRRPRGQHQEARRRRPREAGEGRSARCSTRTSPTPRPTSTTPPSARARPGRSSRTLKVQGRDRRRGAVPRAQGALRLSLWLGRVLPRRHGRRVGARPARAGQPRGRGARARAHDPQLQGPEAEQGDQAPEGRVGLPQLAQPARVDDPRGGPGHPAGAAPDGAARRRPVRHLGPERPLPPRDQPQQPPEAAARPRRARDHRQQREADAAGGRRRAVRQRPPRPPRHGPRQPRAQVAQRHAEGQAGPVPPEPARQARRLLGPFGDRGRAEHAPAPVRTAEADGTRAVQAVHHGPARRAQGRAEHQGRQEDGRVDDPRGLGRARGGHPRAPGAAEPRADASPPGHPGVRAGARRGQGDPGPPAGVSRVQRRLRRRPDGRPRAAVGRGAGRGADPDALVEQHPLAGARRAARDPVAGHGAWHLLPDLRADRRRAGDGPAGKPKFHLPHRAGGRARLRGRPGTAAGPRDIPSPGRRAHHHHGRADPVQRPHRACAGRGAGRRSSTGRARVRQRDADQAGGQRAGLLAGRSSTAPPRWRWCWTPSRSSGFHYSSLAGISISKNDVVTPPDKEEILERYEDEVAGDPRPVRHGPDHLRGAPREGRRQVDRRHRRGGGGDGEQSRPAQPDLHDGQLRCPWLVHADPPAGRACVAR